MLVPRWQAHCYHIHATAEASQGAVDGNLVTEFSLGPTRTVLGRSPAGQMPHAREIRVAAPAICKYHRTTAGRETFGELRLQSGFLHRLSRGGRLLALSVATAGLVFRAFEKLPPPLCGASR